MTQVIVLLEAKMGQAAVILVIMTGNTITHDGVSNADLLHTHTYAADVMCAVRIIRVATNLQERLGTVPTAAW